MLAKYILKRILMAIPVLFGITLMAFLLGVLSPGDPAEIALSSGGESIVSNDQLRGMQIRMGLDEPYPMQYLNWVKNMFKGNWGISYRTKTPVLDEIGARIGITLQLAVGAILLTILVGILLGICSAAYHKKAPDQLIEFFSVICLSVPSFWVAILFINYFSERLHLLPTSGQGSALHLIMPMTVLSLGFLGTTIRLTRSSMLHELAEQYIIAANAKGISQRLILLRHAFSNSITPIITLLGNYFGSVLGGAVVVESIFAINGLGKFALDSITVRDYPALQGYVIVTGTVYVSIHLCTDLLVYVINPQIRLGGKEIL